MYTVLTSLCILAGAVIMLFSVWGAQRVLPLLQESPYRRVWRILHIFMVFFCVGYLVALGLVMTGHTGGLLLVTGVVFFCGALFVSLVIRVSQRTIHDLQQRDTERQQAETALRQAHHMLEQRVAERTASLQEANAHLAQEITERKRTEDALRLSEQQYRALVDGSIQGLYIHQHRIIQLANPALGHIFGYASPDDLVGQDFTCLIAPRDRARLEGYRTDRLQDKPAPERYECQGVRKDGTLIWVECMVSLISWRGAPAIVATFLDITERKRAETQLLQAHDALEVRVVERTAELQRANAVLRSREAHLQSLSEIGKIMSSSLDIQEVYQRFAEEVRQVLPFDRIVIATIDLEQQRGRVTYVWGTEVVTRRPYDTFALAGTMTEAIVRTAAGLRVQVRDADELARQFPGSRPHVEAGLRSFLVLPLVSNDQIIGVLTFEALQPYAYTEQDLHRAESVSTQIAGAIANAQYYAEPTGE